MAVEMPPRDRTRRAFSSEEEAEVAADNVPMTDVMADFERVLRRYHRAQQAAADDVPMAEVMAGFRAALAAPKAADGGAERLKRPVALPAVRPQPLAEPKRGHRYLDEWLAPRPGPLADLVDELVPAVGATEGACRLRERKAADQARLADVCAVVLANLAKAVLVPPETGRVALALGHLREKRSRTCNASFGDKTTDILRAMQELGIIDELRFPLAMRGEASSFAPGADLCAEIVARGVTLDHIGRHPDEWPLKLGRQQPRNGRERRPPPRPVPYADTAETDDMVAQMRRLNRFLAAADIEFIDDGLGRVDAQDRQLRRTFLLLDDDEAPRFYRGGRLAGGFWMHLKSGRRSALRITGEPVADLDFQSMFLGLAYARAKAAMPADADPYALPGLEGYRSGVKRGFAALLFRKRLPPSWGPWMAIGEGPDAGENEQSSDDFDPVTVSATTFADEDEATEIVKGRLPGGWGPGRLREALFRHHPALKGKLRPRLGYELMADESRVLVRVLEELTALGIVALPMHDGVLVPQSKAGCAMEVMEASAVAVTGFPLRVREKMVGGPASSGT